MEKIIALLYLMDNAQQSLPFTGPPARGGPTAGSSAGRYRFTRTAIKTVYEWFSEITHLKMLQITSLMSMTFDNLYLIKGQRKEKGAKQMEERKKTRKTKLQRRYRAYMLYVKQLNIYINVKQLHVVPILKLSLISAWAIESWAE